MDTTISSRTRELFAPLIQRPVLTDQLLQRPPFKFLHDIVHETLRATGHLQGVFSDAELDAGTAGASRDSKVAFLQKLIDVLNVDGQLDGVKPAKIVAGKEPEATNLLLQALATEAGAYATEKAAATSKKSSSKAASSKKKADKEAEDNKSSKKSKDKTSSSSSKHKSSREKEKSKASTDGDERRKRSKSRDTKEADKSSSKTDSKERRKSKRSDSLSRSTTIPKTTKTTKIESPKIIVAPEAVPSEKVPDNIYPQTAASMRTPPPDRESSGGTSKGGDDSGIAEETGAESERHDSDRYGLGAATMNAAGSTHDFIEVHPSGSESPRPTIAAPAVRPGTAIGRPQTAIGRPGTAVARPAPPRPKKKVIAPTTAPEVVEQQQTSAGAEPDPNFGTLILDEAETAGAGKKDEENFLLEEDEDEDEKLLRDSGIATGEGANVAQLQSEGEDAHGMLVNRIVENTRKLEEQEMQDDDSAAHAVLEESEQRRVRAEVEAVQRALQRASQHVQPLVRTLDHVADDFDAMVRELDECRKQSAVLERQLQERAQQASVHNTQQGGALRALDEQIREAREQLAQATASVLTNERKMEALLLSSDDGSI